MVDREAPDLPPLGATREIDGASVRLARYPFADGVTAFDHAWRITKVQAAPARERMSARNRLRCSVISRMVAGGAAVW